MALYCRPDTVLAEGVVAIHQVPAELLNTILPPSLPDLAPVQEPTTKLFNPSNLIAWLGERDRYRAMKSVNPEHVDRGLQGWSVGGKIHRHIEKHALILVRDVVSRKNGSNPNRFPRVDDK